MTVDEVLDFFVAVSPLYKARFLTPGWAMHPNCLEDPVRAIRLFLWGYAFERQGRNPSYAHAAAEAIGRVANDHNDHPDAIAQAVWREFAELLGGKGLNEKMNPLYHEAGSCRCVWCATGQANMMLTAKDAIARGQVEEVWRKIQCVRGAGPKIASLFLRDIAVKYELTPAQDRWLLQPVDVWVRRVVLWLAENHHMNDQEIAKWLVSHCKQPESANQGIWYFSAQIAGSEFKSF